MKKKLFKIALFLFLIGLLSAFGTYLYVFHKPHRNIAKEKPAFSLHAFDLLGDFISDEMGSYEKYGNKVLLITGEVADISVSDKGASILLINEFEGISCSFDSLDVEKHKSIFSDLTPGSTVQLKGQCDGYDAIMGVVLTRCVIIN